MVSLVLFDDVRAHNELLETLLRQIIEEEKLDAQVVFAATRASELLEYAFEHPVGNVFFLDIELQERFTGVDVCRKLHELDPKAHIVFVSAYPHYAMECVKAHAFDFLLKPFTNAELRDCLTAVLRDKTARAAARPLTITLGSRTVVLDQRDIGYFTTRRNFLVAHTAQGEYTWRESLASALECVEAGSFRKISRSCAVNLNHIREVNWADDCIVMNDGTQLPISRRARAALKDLVKIGSQTV